MVDKPNGSNGGVYASNIPDWTRKDTDPVFEGEPCSKGEVMAYVQNAFLTWHKPDHDITLKLASVLDTLFLYLQERGLEVRDGRVYIQPEDVAAWASARKAVEATKPEDAA